MKIQRKMIFNTFFLYACHLLCRKWHSKAVPSCSSSSTRTAVITSGATSSMWRRTAYQTSPCPGSPTCSCWCPGSWGIWHPAPWPSRHHRVSSRALNFIHLINTFIHYYYYYLLFQDTKGSIPGWSTSCIIHLIHLLCILFIIIPHHRVC